MSLFYFLRCRTLSSLVRIDKSAYYICLRKFYSLLDQSVQSNARRLYVSSEMSQLDLPVFEGKLNSHKNIIVESTAEPCANLTEFSNKLEASIKKWESEKVRGVWFAVALPDAEWIPILAKNNFKVHHGKGDVINMARWLSKEESDKIPHFAHTMLGAGGIVINSKNQILSVCEKYREMPYWKLPGGYVEPGEDIIAAVQREVLEETNIKTNFVSLVTIRHSKRAVFDCSDLYFIAELTAINENIVKQDEEIHDIKWMDINEYLNHPLVHENNRYFVQKYLQNKKNNIIIEREPRLHPITNSPQVLYSVSANSGAKS